MSAPPSEGAGPAYLRPAVDDNPRPATVRRTGDPIAGNDSGEIAQVGPVSGHETEHMRKIQDLKDQLRKLENSISSQAHGKKGNSDQIFKLRPGTLLEEWENCPRYIRPSLIGAFIGYFLPDTAECEYDLFSRLNETPAGDAPWKELKKFRKPPNLIPPRYQLYRYRWLLELLPSQEICQKLVQIYFENFERSWRILHRPTFLKQCETFWACRQEEPWLAQQRVEEFGQQLALVVIIASTLSDVFHGGFSDRYILALMMDSLEYDSDRSDTFHIRTKCLAILPKELLISDNDETEDQAADLLQLAVRAGMHLDPASWPEVSPFDGEQRRKLFFTIVELNLRGSFFYDERVAFRFQATDFSCSLPLNVDDQDLHEDMGELPPAKPMEQSTHASPQIQAARSLPMSLHILDTAKPSRGHVSPDDLLTIVEACRESSLVSPTASGPADLLDHMMGVISFQRPIAILYLTLDKTSSSLSGILDEFNHFALQFASMVLSFQDAFDPSLTDSEAEEATKHGNIFYRLFTEDLVQSCLVLLLAIHTMNQRTRSESDSTTRAQTGPMWTKATLVKAIDSTVKTLIERIDRHDIDIEYPMTLSIFLRSVRGSGNLNQEELDAALLDTVRQALEARKQDQ